MYCTEIEDYVDHELLDDTPIGKLLLVPWGNSVGVAIADIGEPDRPKRICYTLGVDENPLNAIYGKRTFERMGVIDAYHEMQRRRDKGLEGNARDMAKDARIDTQKQLEKSWDGGVDELLRRAMGMKPDR